MRTLRPTATESTSATRRIPPTKAGIRLLPSLRRRRKRALRTVKSGRDLTQHPSPLRLQRSASRRHPSLRRSKEEVFRLYIASLQISPQRLFKHISVTSWDVGWVHPSAVHPVCQSRDVEVSPRAVGSVLEGSGCESGSRLSGSEAGIDHLASFRGLNGLHRTEAAVVCGDVAVPAQAIRQVMRHFGVERARKALQSVHFQRLLERDRMCGRLCEAGDHGSLGLDRGKGHRRGGVGQWE